MSTPSTSSAMIPDPVIERLNEKGIHRVIVIDDAYDAPTRADLELNELAEFWNALDPDSPDQQEVLREILGDIPESEDDISDAGVAALYNNRNALDALQVAFDLHLRAALEQKHNNLEPFTNRLRDELGLEVVTYGTADSIDHTGASIIFLDYYLGNPRDQASTAAARDTIRSLLKTYEVGADKPLVVLMSSDADVKALSEDFRSKTGIVVGMFYFVPKSDLNDKVKMMLNLEMLAASLPAGHHIQKFIDAIEAKIETIAYEFLAGIKRLNLDDYVFIQRLSLQADGHPMGDYLLWLFGAYFGHLMFERALSSERSELDSLTFSDWIPSHAIPSKQLTTMYHVALFDTTVGELAPHPRTGHMEEKLASEAISTSSIVCQSSGVGQEDSKSDGVPHSDDSAERTTQNDLVASTSLETTR